MCPGKRVTRSRRCEVDDAEDKDNDDDEDDEGDSTGIKWEEETASGRRPPPPIPVDEETR